MSELDGHTGGCLCGGVRYRVRGPLRDVIACHCTQCRRASGHYSAYSSAEDGDLVLEASGTLAWYDSSAQARRGFCRACGSNLFWRPTAPGTARTSIAAGTIDGPTGLRTTLHIYAADRGDYYPLPDDAPCHDAD